MAPGANHVTGEPVKTTFKGNDAKAETYRRIDALKQYVTAGSIVGFGVFSGIAASHGIAGGSASADSASASGSSLCGQSAVPQSQDNQGGLQSQFGNGDDGGQANQNYGNNQGTYGFGSGGNQAPIARSGTS